MLLRPPRFPLQALADRQQFFRAPRPLPDQRGIAEIRRSRHAVHRRRPEKAALNRAHNPAAASFSTAFRKISGEFP